MERTNNIELLAPVGNLEAFYAAVNAGASAVYLGGKMFSARAYASNFSLEEIKFLIKEAHRRDVKVYITCNTLLFEDEFQEAINFIDELYKADVDGILIQDLGLAYYLHKVYPSLVLHASTQLNCHNEAEAKALINLGFKRIVLAREVSLETAKKIKALGVEVEVFVHGALCVSYSGLCLMSSFIGGRSGNRGKCAQPCRNKMKVINETRESNDFGISTKDLSTLPYLDKLIESGVDSLKIEGRMKRKEYVYQVVSSYRKAIDSYFNKVSFNYEEENKKNASLFNRMFTKGFIFNESRTSILNQKTSSHQGSVIGKVISFNKDYVNVLLKEELTVNDGIRFNNSFQDGQIIQKMFVSGEDKKVAYPNEIVKIKRYNVRLNEGDEVILTTSSSLLDKINELIFLPYRLPLKIIVEGKLNSPLQVKMIYKDYVVSLKSDFILEKAKANPLTKDVLEDKLSKLGDSNFYLKELEVNLESDLFIPLKELNEIRRKGITLLSSLMENKNHYSLDDIHPYFCDLVKQDTNNINIIKVETKEQLEKVKERSKIYIQNEELFKSNPSLNHALYRINEKDDSLALDNEMITYPKIIKGENVITSPYFNLVNSYALDYAYSLGIKKVILSFELSKENIIQMIEAFKLRHGFNPNLGMLVYGHVDLMIMKPCPIGNMYNVKNDHCNLCKKGNYYLLSPNNEKLKMLHDENCITRILSSKPICLIDKIDELRGLGISFFYYDFTLETREETNNILENKISYQEVIRGHYNKRIE